MSDVSEFYKGVHLMERQIIKAVHQGQYPAQPKPIFILDQLGNEVPSVDFLYLVSRNSRLHRTTAGAVCMVSLRQAAECVFSESHSIATADQIDGFKRLQAGNLRAREISDAQYRRQSGGAFEITLPPTGKQAA